MSVLIAIPDVEASVRILVDMFENQFINVEKIIARNLHIPSSMQTRDFYARLQIVLDFRKQMIAYRWRNFIDSCYKSFLSSHEAYLTFIMFACIAELRCHEDIVKIFLSVCALVKLLNDETLEKTGVNFCDLNPDIIKVFYNDQLKGTFCRSGGLQRLLTFICDNEYITWKLNKNYSTDAPTRIEMILDEIFQKQMRGNHVIGKETNPDEALGNEESKAMAAKVLSVTLVKLPPLPSNADLIERLVAFRKKDAKKIEDNEETKAAEKYEALNVPSHECQSLNSISHLSYDEKHEVSIEWYENIIQAVIRHNNSKIYGYKNAKGKNQEEADGVLERLKDKIKSLLRVLNEYDKE